MSALTDQPIQTLLELVQQHKLDPWDIDIERLACLYIQRIREMAELDLRASGRALLSSSVLLRIKSDYTLGHSKQIITEEGEDLLDINLPDLGEITIIQSTPRKITLVELISALKDAIAEMPERKLPISRKMEKIVQTLDEYELNIIKHMALLHKRILSLIDSGMSLTMFKLMEEKTRLALARTLLLLLYLCAEGKVSLEQREMFGDIFVSIPKGQVGKNGN